MTSNNLALCIDLSTTCTGWALFDVNTKELLKFGRIITTSKFPKLSYPLKQLRVCQNIADQILSTYNEYGNSITYIVIEEINRHKSRLSGKTLDVMHGILWAKLDELCSKIIYIDSDGYDGWRTLLKLKLSDSDKLKNTDAKKLNKSMAKKHKLIPIINKKHLAQRFVNKFYNLAFDVDAEKMHSDVVDAIGLGHAFVHFKLK
jgi:hypothetical protein